MLLKSSPLQSQFALFNASYKSPPTQANLVLAFVCRAVALRAMPFCNSTTLLVILRREAPKNLSRTQRPFARSGDMIDRRFILVEIEPTIAQAITAERLKRVIQG